MIQLTKIRKKMIVTVILGAGVITMTTLGIGRGNANLVKAATPPTRMSPAGFWVTLPSQDWKFLSDPETVRLLGSHPGAGSIAVADTRDRVYGVLNGFQAGSSRIPGDNPDVTADKLRAEFLDGYRIINRKVAPDSVVLEGFQHEGNIDQTALVAFKKVGSAGVLGFFAGPSSAYKEMRQNILSLVNSMGAAAPGEYLRPVTPRQIYVNNADAVVQVRVYDENHKKVGQGSGFNIHPDGVIVANIHTIGAGRFVDVKFPRHGVYEDVIVAGMNNKLHDVVLLRVDGRNLPVIDASKSVGVEVGDKVFVISNPEALVNSLSEGIVSGIRRDGKKPYYQITAPISPGSSGGAVFNEYGSVIGIATMSYDTGQNLNFCIPITEIGDTTPFDEPVTLENFKVIVGETLIR